MLHERKTRKAPLWAHLRRIDNSSVLLTPPWQARLQAAGTFLESYAPPLAGRSPRVGVFFALTATVRTAFQISTESASRACVPRRLEPADRRRHGGGAVQRGADRPCIRDVRGRLRRRVPAMHDHGDARRFEPHSAGRWGSVPGIRTGSSVQHEGRFRRGNPRDCIHSGRPVTLSDCGLVRA